MALDMEAAGSTGVLSSNADDGVNKPEIDQTQNVTSTAKRGRRRDPVDKEYRRHKRSNESVIFTTVMQLKRERSDNECALVLV